MTDRHVVFDPVLFVVAGLEASRVVSEGVP
jgi:hypothetical protein